MQRDAEKGETSPLLDSQTTCVHAPRELLTLALMKQKHSGAPNFHTSVEVAFTAALFACLISCVIWNDATRAFFSGFFSEDCLAYVPTAVLLFAYTVYPSFGQTVKLLISGTLGTALACLNIWILHQLFPGGVAAHVVQGADGAANHVTHSRTE